MMEGSNSELRDRFAPPNKELRPEVLGELESMLRLHSISAEELYYKWESYSMKMGSDEIKMDLKTARDFKKDIQDNFDREIRSKASKGGEKKGVGATPRPGANNTDVFGMLEGLVPNTPRHGGTAGAGANGSTSKRKANFATPAAKISKPHIMSSPSDSRTPRALNGLQSLSFPDRLEPGRIDVSINEHIEIPQPPENRPAEPRIKLKANTEISKFSFKTMAMKMSEASEILDDRIEEFIQIVQTHHDLDDSAFGNPSTQSTSEIIAVGRIANDSNEGKLNTASLMLESSRRTGAGVRIPLQVDALPSYEFFPGQIVALKGTNASGEFFTVSEVLSIPLLPPAATEPATLDEFGSRLSSDEKTRPLNIMIASGPYTTDSDCDFSALEELISKAITSYADALILTGPFLDAHHPMIRSGSFPIPENLPNPDTATLTDLFRYYISRNLNVLATELPSCQIILVPSVRDAAHPHAAWPQDRFHKPTLGLPKKVSCVSNPVTLSFNELVVGMGSLDVLDMVRREECVGGSARSTNVFDRISRALVEQRSFCPVFPPTARESLPAVADLPKHEDTPEDSSQTEKENADAEDDSASFAPLGAMLDISYLKLGDWLNVRPDLLISPSSLTPFVRIVDDVCVINPGSLCRRRGYGTYARMTILPPQLSDEERQTGEVVAHKLYERARVDIVKI